MTDTDLSHRSIARWAADCAERVLGRFEGEHPNDPRPRKAIEAARAWAAGLLPMPMARKAAFAAHAARWQADRAEFYGLAADLSGTTKRDV